MSPRRSAADYKVHEGQGMFGRCNYPMIHARRYHRLHPEADKRMAMMVCVVCHPPAAFLLAAERERMAA